VMLQRAAIDSQLPEVVIFISHEKLPVDPSAVCPTSSTLGIPLTKVGAHWPEVRQMWSHGLAT
jgi:hypothetical protein